MLFPAGTVNRISRISIEKIRNSDNQAGAQFRLFLKKRGGDYRNESWQGVCVAFATSAAYDELKAKVGKPKR